MDTQTRIEIIADITEIMKKDTQDKEFLQELMDELQEAY